MELKLFHDNPLEILTINDGLKSMDSIFRQNKKAELEDDIENVEYLRIEDSSQDIIKAVRGACGRSCIRELSLSYSLLNEDLLRAISLASDDFLIETLKIDVYPDSHPLVPINKEAWLILNTTHLSKFNVALNCYIENDADYEVLLKDASIPVTHLFLGGPVSATTIKMIIQNCSSRLIELIVTSYAPGLMDDELLLLAKASSKLVALGLGECEITCSALVTFVEICKERLQILYVWETSLVEDAHFDTNSTVTKVSSILGREWAPEYVPPW